MPLKPWYTIVTPREDLREGKSLEQTEFAVHLDHVRERSAPEVYSDPERFFERTFLTQNLTTLAAEVLRRLSGETTEASPVFNLATQFGGGKTHALTLLYHLAQGGLAASGWIGVSKLLERARVASVPAAATAVFVGTQFDSIRGRGGDDGTPKRLTPWGDIAYQLGGDEGFALVAEQDKQLIAPGGEVIQKLLPADQPSLILIDEVMNYVSRYRTNGLGGQFYNFLQSLSEECRGRSGVVLAVSIPKSELEMTADDQSDYQRFDKMLSRIGKAIVMSAEEETSEIIRRRLFEWDADKVSQSGKVILPREAMQVAQGYAEWVVEYRRSLPEWFPVDHAQDAFQATYPFHPSVISVFERKWQALPQFQRTRGVLQMLATWVAEAYQAGFKDSTKDLLITLGTAPLNNSLFRTSVLNQLGEQRLEAVVTTDICGRKESHAIRLDQEATEAIGKSRLHCKVATTVFFESNGGQLHDRATVPEIRLAVGDPQTDIGNIETVLETLSESCYYLSIEKNKYYFSQRPNLNKILADRRASIQQSSIDELARKYVQTVFNKGPKITRNYFPSDSSSIPNIASLTLVVLPPDQSAGEDATLRMMDTITRECGGSGRTFKSALIWCVPDSAAAIAEEARRLLAWEDIRQEHTEEQLGSEQWIELKGNIERSKRSLEETVWRAYRFVYLLGKENELRQLDLGRISSSASETLVTHIVQHLRLGDELISEVAPSFLVRNWPPALTEWSTRNLRDVFYASPIYPRLLNPDSVKTTVAHGVTSGTFAYVTKANNGGYATVLFEQQATDFDISIDDDSYIITRATYLEYLAEHAKPQVGTDGGNGDDETFMVDPILPPKTTPVNSPTGLEQEPIVAGFRWEGEIPQQKWMTFYNLISNLGATNGARFRIVMDVTPQGGVLQRKVDEVRAALREMGLGDEVEIVGEGE